MMLLSDYQMTNLTETNRPGGDMYATEVRFASDFTESQKELVQKFNAAFYEAQAQHRPASNQAPEEHENILDTFDEKYFTNIEKYEEADLIGDGYFFDFLVPKSDDAPPNQLVATNGGDVAFDYNEFCEKFEQQVSNESESKRNQTASYLSQYGIMIENLDEGGFDNVFRTRNPSVSTETTTSTSGGYVDVYSCTSEKENNSPFFVPLPFETRLAQSCDGDDLENLDLSDIDLSESVSNTSIDLDNLGDLSYEYDGCQFEYQSDCKVKLPPVNTIVKSNMDFTNRLRGVAPETLRFENQGNRNAYGHLIGNKSINNNVSTINLVDEDDLSCSDNNNQATMRQCDALLYDDPLLSSSSLILPRRIRKDTEESEMSTDCEENYVGHLQCKWENCFQIYECQTSLVKHIEKYHVELKRGEEFTCFWLNCPRKSKPFNARYKLLIHMRVHSGEKPNKCPFGGCNKAFSRLENLKIHQRSHTGERPYLCQISNCTKSFSNSSDRAKHQRTHFDTKPYACQVAGCSKKYTDPSSLRKHVKNHTYEEQVQLKKKSSEYRAPPAPRDSRKGGSNNEAATKRCVQAAPKGEKAVGFGTSFYTTLEHSYSNSFVRSPYILSANVKQDLKNKISEKMSKEKLLVIA